MNFAQTLKTNPKTFKIRQHDPAFKGDLRRSTAERLQVQHLNELQNLQDRLFAEGKQAVLVIIQGMDAAGKDGIVKHVMSGLNPAGCQVSSFKLPSESERKHGYLYRVHSKTPEKGTIGIFNRSHYEEVLVVRVHPEILQTQFLTDAAINDSHIWKNRYKDINAFEEYLNSNGVRVVKFFLHLSHQEQGRRFLGRLEDKTKHWKFSKSDLAERQYWNEYQKAFEEMIKRTSTRHAPWYIIPADRKWFARAAVGGILVQTLREMKPKYPRVSKSDTKQLKKLRKKLKHQINKEKPV